MKAQLRLLVVAIITAAFLFTGAAAARTPGQGAAPLMKAIVYRNYGPPDVLRLEEIEKPVPNENQVLVRVRAASVNPLDFHYMRGTPYLVRLFDSGLLKPGVTRLGVDMAGVVEAVGGKVTQFKPGDEVFGHRWGALAEYVCVSESALVMKPGNVTFEQAAAVPIAAVTALQGLRDKGKIQPGQKVLINGASGGVGTFAVQIAKSFGADVTGVCSARNADMVRSIGADRVIDYTKEDFTRSGQRYDLILDMVSNHSLSDVGRALTPKGILVMVGSTDTGLWLKPLVMMLEPVLRSPFVSQEYVGILANLNKEDLTILGDLMRDGKVTPVIDRRYRLSEAPEAMRYLEEGHARGKVVITMDDDDESPPAGVNAAADAAGSTGPVLVVLAVTAIAVGVPVAVALALNRRFQRRHPGKKPYRWGYYFGIQSFVCGLGLGFMLESGAGALIACGGIYALLAWFFARRRRWAWITLTILSFNPVAWVVNLVYCWRRWTEDAVATPAVQRAGL